MAADQWFRVTFRATNGLTYGVVVRAGSDVDAVRFADRTLEHVERVGISDFLAEDGVTVTPPARLRIERIEAREAGPGFAITVTDRQGNVTRR